MILLSESEKKKRYKKIQEVLVQVSRSLFWREHFKHHGYIFNKKGFSWSEWEKIPPLTKKEFLSLGLKLRLDYAQKNIKKKTMHFLLQSTSGTSKFTGPVLFLKNIDTLVEGPWENAGDRMIVGYQGRAISLRDVIAFIHRNKTSLKNPQALVVNPFRFDNRMISALEEFNGNSIITFPACVSYLTSTFPRIKKIIKKFKLGLFSGDFISNLQYSFIKKTFPNFTITLDYIMTEVDTMGLSCSFLRKKYGMNTYHPIDEKIVEVVDIDENGCGEVVITKIYPEDLAIIRYRTGDIAKIFHASCPCGKEWTFTLQGRSNMDYIKQIGVLITRTEIEKAVKLYEAVIEEWRGEVREKKVKGKLLSELLLKVTLKKTFKNEEKAIIAIQKKMSDTIYLAPQKTISALVEEKKFLPLKIEVIEEMPIESKKVLLRKIF